MENIASDRFNYVIHIIQKYGLTPSILLKTNFLGKKKIIGNMVEESCNISGYYTKEQFAIINSVLRKKKIKPEIKVYPINL